MISDEQDGYKYKLNDWVFQAELELKQLWTSASMMLR